MDLLDLLLQDPHENARQRLRAALDSDAHPVEEVTFNVFEVTLDREVNEARVFDVLDGTADPAVMSLDELRRRLAPAPADEGETVGHAVGMEAVVIRDVRTALVLSDPETTATAPATYLSVTIEGPDLRASRQVYEGYDGGFSSLAGYFADLAADWRGWTGSRDYESIEGDLRIRATHDGHVNLRVLLRESTVPEGWRVEAEVRLDAGEALSAAAADIAELVRARLP